MKYIPLQKKLKEIASKGKEYYTYKDNYMYRKKDYGILHDRRRKYAKVKLLLKLPKYKLISMEIWHTSKVIITTMLRFTFLFLFYPIYILHKIFEIILENVDRFFYNIIEKKLDTTPIWIAKEKEAQ